MPITPTYPGVYIEEIPSGVRTISGVATSVTAFVGYTARGPLNQAVRIFNFGDYERNFGGLDRESEISYAVQQFFLNGGSDAYVVRIADGAISAGVTLKDSTSTPADTLKVVAASPGKWGEDLRTQVDYKTADKDNLFNLSVLRVDPITNVEAVLATYRNLSMNPRSGAYAPNAINNSEPKLLQVESVAAFDDNKDRGYSLSGDLTKVTLTNEESKITVILDGDTNNPHELKLFDLNANPPANLGAIVTALTTSIANAGLNTRLQTVRTDEQGVDAAAGNFLKLVSVFVSNNNDTKAQFSSVRVVASASNDAAVKLKLGLANGGKEVEGSSARRPAEGKASLGNGSNGRPPNDPNLILGNEDSKTGMYALLDVDLFNILVIPRTAQFTETQAKAIINAATALCEKCRAFYLIDPPKEKVAYSSIKDWVNGLATNKNTAVFFPRIQIADPLDGFRLRDIPASAAIAGIFARTDSERGVWKAPAGIDAVVRGAQALTYKLTDKENGVLNVEGINCIRTFPVYGTVVWGARTRRGADQLADTEWKYIPVRRLALFLEESLYRGTQWVVFEPNDEPLWSQIRLNIGAFMNNLFKQGAFQGKTPKEAYFVKCDSETTTQYDIDRGIVNIVIGFAPLKPAEFVILKFQQMTRESAV